MAVELPPGARIRIVDTVGGQIGALAAFAEADLERGIAFNDSLAYAYAHRPEGDDGPDGLIEGEQVLTAEYEALLEITADTIAEKDISNMHTLICNPAAFRLAGDDPDQSCFGALLKAIEP